MRLRDDIGTDRATSAVIPMSSIEDMHELVVTVKDFDGRWDEVTVGEYDAFVAAFRKVRGP